MARNISVFVYGTLMKGQGNHELLRLAKRVGEDSMEEMKLYDLGPFPAAVRSAYDGDVIHGEHYLVNEKEFASLDRLEGYPHFYTRSLLPLKNDDRPTWVYHFKSENEVRERGTRIASGKWTPQYLRV
jgi:gamma-glutamylcyclotransferase (GGCT)/AIG2-like uncharacterized protein YtfP